MENKETDKVNDVFRVNIVNRLSATIRPMLARHDPEIAGATLADLVAVFIVCHHPDLRDDILEMHIKLVRDLIPATEKELLPNGWRL